MFKLILISFTLALTSCANVRAVGLSNETKGKGNVVAVKISNNSQDAKKIKPVISQKYFKKRNRDRLQLQQSSVRREGHAGAQRKVRKSKNIYQFGNQQLKFPKKLFSFWVNYFSKKSRDRFIRFYKNGQSVHHIVAEAMKRHDLPEELFYVGLIESGYNNLAKSHASAVGPWQFIKGTATRYGLRVDRYVDERKNIYKASEAAAMYFKDLYNIFGSWELALSAYNAGEYRIINAIRKGNTRDFHELVEKKLLPKETIYYVPKIMAAKYLIENSKRYDLDVKSDSKSIYDDVHETKLRYPFSLFAIAKRTKIPYSLLKKLNSDIKGNWTKIRKGRTHTLYLPKKMGEGRVYSRLTQKNPYKQSPIQNYLVREGDSLLAIAHKFGVGLSELKRENRLKSNVIRLGQMLRIPLNQKSKVHVVKKGDNVYAIAKMYDVPLSKIFKINQLKSGKIYPGQKLVVPMDI